MDKKFPIKSPELSRRIGRSNIKKLLMVLTVDVHNPDIYLYIDIKQKAYVYTDRIKGYGGILLEPMARAYYFCQEV